MSSAPTVAEPPICPVWCVLPAGHDAEPDRTDGARYIRHRAATGYVELEQTVIVEASGAMEAEAPVVRLAGGEHSLDAAARLADELLAALDATGRPLALAGA